ncbi:ring-hydroxylating dioxygenase subunit beta [Vulcanimicrobium alpinum]|uniref:Ring-hydroxylating dioxygenase subunit beta n=1 Tax=Vulcanimicrobium alpinum TaxID=3016050 RepID=A0AAN1XVN5_UNVUL|nr:aromatic-ring-hydroxylating dioxygenase subunit beta [Vulcanimicrobium alpinum]BDE05286.1 ring-hydroxylating dioxygenase subunit beta [Vulcanimicrobium alpinum]
MIAGGERAVSAEERFAIEDLYAAYAHALDDGRYADWPEFFTDDCVYRIVARENYERGLPLAILSFESKGMLHDRVYGVTQTLFHEPYVMRHAIGSFLIARAGADAYDVRANYVIVRTKANALSEVYNAGRYVDRVERAGGRLLFREKVCVFDSETIPNSLIYPI